MFPSEPGIEDLIARIAALTAKCGGQSAVLEPVRRAYAAFRDHHEDEAVALAALEQAVVAAELGFAPA